MHRPSTLSPPRSVDGPSGSPSPVRGLLLGCVGLLVGALPALYAIYILWGFWTAVSEMTPQPASIETRGLYGVAAAATGIGFAACCPVALLLGAIARRQGSPSGAAIAKLGSLLFLSPLPLVLAGLPVICWLQGIELRW